MVILHTRRRNFEAEPRCYDWNQELETTWLRRCDGSGNTRHTISRERSERTKLWVTESPCLYTLRKKFAYSRAKNCFIWPEKDNRDHEALLDVEALDSLIAIYWIGGSPAGLSLTVRRNLGANAGSSRNRKTNRGDKERARSRRRDGRRIL